MQNNLKALSGRVIVQPIEELMSGILHLPANKIERGGSLVRCKVISSGIEDIPIDVIVHCKAELGYRVPMSSSRIYLAEDVVLIEFPPQLTAKKKSRDARDLNKLRA